MYPSLIRGSQVQVLLSQDGSIYMKSFTTQMKVQTSGLVLMETLSSVRKIIAIVCLQG